MKKSPDSANLSGQSLCLSTVRDFLLIPVDFRRVEFSTKRATFEGCGRDGRHSPYGRKRNSLTKIRFYHYNDTFSSSTGCEWIDARPVPDLRFCRHPVTRKTLWSCTLHSKRPSVVTFQGDNFFSSAEADFSNISTFERWKFLWCQPLSCILDYFEWKTRIEWIKRIGLQTLK